MSGFVHSRVHSLSLALKIVRMCDCVTIRNIHKGDTHSQAHIEKTFHKTIKIQIELNRHIPRCITNATAALCSVNSALPHTKTCHNSGLSGR